MSSVNLTSKPYDLTPPSLVAAAFDRLTHGWPKSGVRCTLDSPCQTPQGFESFRRVDGPLNITKGLPAPSTRGLSTLRASGSSQFTPAGLACIRDSLPSSAALLDVDIRQESHGYDDETSLGWWKANNSGNMHKDPPQVRDQEVAALSKLNALPPGSHFTAYECIGKESHTKRISLAAGKAYDEAALARAYHVGYARIPMTDRCAYPVDAAVELFVNRLLDLPEPTWVHFHCLHGHGRTTLYMSMYDMLRNADVVSFDDVVDRQYFLGGVNLRHKSDATLLFLSRFHSYTQVCLAAVKNQSLVPTWSRWKKTYVEHDVLADFISRPPKAVQLDFHQLTPARYEHINPYGKYLIEQSDILSIGCLRPLRGP